MYSTSLNEGVVPVRFRLVFWLTKPPFLFINEKKVLRHIMPRKQPETKDSTEFDPKNMFSKTKKGIFVFTKKYNNRKVRVLG